MRTYSLIGRCIVRWRAYHLRRVREVVPLPGETVYKVEFSAIENGAHRIWDDIYIYSADPWGLSDADAWRYAISHARGCMDLCKVRDVSVSVAGTPRGGSMAMKYRVRDGRVIHEWC